MSSASDRAFVVAATGTCPDPAILVESTDRTVRALQNRYYTRSPENPRFPQGPAPLPSSDAGNPAAKLHRIGDGFSRHRSPTFASEDVECWKSVSLLSAINVPAESAMALIVCPGADPVPSHTTAASRAAL
jgi:hypothetical protein